MKIIFFLPAGVVEYPIPEDLKPTFHFNQVATQIRMAGYFMADNLYLNHAYIVGMSFSPDDSAPQVPKLPDGQRLQ
jgi:hypothetical protein